MSFMSISGKDLNHHHQHHQEMHVSTPSKSGSSSRLGRVSNEDDFNKQHQSKFDLMEESTLQGEVEDIETTFTKTSSQFDKIAENVNITIKELCQIYNEIGYSSTETSIKKSEIFTVIQDTIMNFTNNLQREKSNIENECEWLRQQIRIILAMMGDNTGAKSLSLLSRGLVFNDHELYLKGYKEEAKSEPCGAKNMNFYASSPFNVSQIQFNSSNADVSQDGCESHFQPQPLEEVAKLSLFQQKGKLNSIFLEVLKRFVEIFKKFNDSMLLRYEIIECIGEEVHSTGVSDVWLESLPSRDDSEAYRELIEKFESIIRQQQSHGQHRSFDSGFDDAYIVSSPRKPKGNDESPKKDQSSTSEKDLMGSLREVNYKLVRLIRSLKITKITQDIFQTLQKEIEYCEIELNSRMLVMHETIERAFELIEILQLTEDQIASVQKRYDSSTSVDSHCSTTSINNCLLDQETLRFIQSNPREFGLSNNHLGYINGFTDILKKIKDTKQKKWDHYFSSCLTLWEKLGEDPQYIEQFVESNNLLTDEALLNFKQELNRLFLKRSQYIESFIVDSRTEIELLWNKLHYDQNQRESFKYYDNSSGCIDKESVLNEHEEELQKLNQEYSDKRVMLELYQQLEELLKDQNFLRESSKDSSRLLSKNSCKILLNEEKLRKKINKNLPLVIRDLKVEIIKFNNEQLNHGGKPITLYGNDFFEKVIILESEVQASKNVRAKPKPKPKPKVSSAPPNRVSGHKISKRTAPAAASRTASLGTHSKNSSSKGSPALKRSPLNSASTGFAASLSNQNALLNRSPALSASRTSSKLYSPISIHQQKYPESSSFLGISPLKHLNALKPLNTPLASNSSTYSRFESPSQPSNQSKLSPLKASFRYSVLPAKTIEDKENSFCSKYSLSPIKITEYLNSSGGSVSYGGSAVSGSAPGSAVSTLPTVIDNSTFDSSTVIGDDYQTWRNERIKQLNNL